MGRPGNTDNLEPIYITQTTRVYQFLTPVIFSCLDCISCVSKTTEFPCLKFVKEGHTDLIQEYIGLIFVS